MIPGGRNLERILDSVHDGIYVVDSYRKITEWNKGAERLTGFARSEVVGASCSDILMHVDRAGRTLCNTRDCPSLGALADGETHGESLCYTLHKEGFRMPVAIQAIPILGEGGEVESAAVVFGDLTSRFVQLKRHEEAQRILRLDPAAELDNKRELEVSLHMGFDEMQRYGWPFGILFFEVDGLEEAVERHGQEIGRRLQKMVAKTLLSGIRSTDSLGRWDANVFIAIVRDVNEHQLNVAAERVRMLVEMSLLRHEGEPFSATISTGATVAKASDTVYTLLKRAEDLMRQSSRGGRNRVTTDAEV